MSSQASIASSSLNSWGRSTFDSRTGGPFRTSSSPHPSAMSNFAGVNTSLADAVKHVWGASALPITAEQQRAQQQHINEQRRRAVSAHVLDNSTKRGLNQQQQHQSTKPSTFQQALQGVVTASWQRDGDPVDSARGLKAPQYDHFFKGNRVPVLNQNGVPHGDLVLMDTSPMRLSALAGGKNHRFPVTNPPPSAAEKELARLRRMSPTERQAEHIERVKRQTKESMLRNLTTLNSSLLGSSSIVGDGTAALPKFLRESNEAEEAKKNKSAEGGAPSAFAVALAAPSSSFSGAAGALPRATPLTTEALASAALSRIAQDIRGANTKNSGSKKFGNPAATVSVPPLFQSTRAESNNDDDAVAVSLTELAKMEMPSASAAKAKSASLLIASESTTNTRASSVSSAGMTARPVDQSHGHQPNPAASAHSSARGSARRHVDVSGTSTINMMNANESNWDAYAGTPYERKQAATGAATTTTSRGLDSARRLEAVYGTNNNNNFNNVSRGRTPVRQTTPNRRGAPAASQQQPTGLSSTAGALFPASDLPSTAALFYSAQHAQSEKHNTAQAVLAASHLFVRTIGAEATAGSIDVSASTAATLHLGHNKAATAAANNMSSLMSTVSSIRRTAHAEFAELYQQCENIWAELGTSLAAREKAAYALFPMLFSGAPSAFTSTQLASHRATVVKYINRLSTQLELTAGANEAMNARDSAVFDIIVISKRYTDYVKSTFGASAGWREKAAAQGAAVAMRDEQVNLEATAAAAQATALKHELRVALQKYRMCTLIAVEAIAKWMEFTGRVDFWWRNRPALLHMCVDLHQLAFSRRPLLYLLGFDVVHNPFALPGEKWYVVPRRERRLASVSPARASAMQQRASSMQPTSSSAAGQRSAAVVGVTGPSSSVSGSNRRSASSSKGRSQTQRERRSSSAAVTDDGAAWGAANHKTVSVIDPRRKDGESQNFILINEVGQPLRLGTPAVLSSARAASIASHHRQEQKQREREAPLSSMRNELSPERQMRHQQQNPHQRGGGASASAVFPPSSAIPDFELPISATTVAPFWRQMEADDFHIRTRLESALVLLRHAVLQCVVPIQACMKRFVYMLRYRSAVAKIRRLQRAVREWVVRKELERTIKIAAWRFLYKVFNGYAARFELGKKSRATMTLQRWWRGCLDRRWLAHAHAAACRLQRWVRPAVRKIINRRRARVKKIQLLHAVARGYLERRRFWMWAAHTLASRRRNIGSLMHIERERRVEIQKLYWEATCFGLFLATTASSSSSISTLSPAVHGSSSSSSFSLITPSSIFAPYLLHADELRTLPRVLRPVHGPLGSWAQLTLLRHAEAFRADALRLEFLHCAAAEHTQRSRVIMRQEQEARLCILAPAHALLRCVEAEIRYCEQARRLLEFSLEPDGRSVLTDTLRRERYRIHVECENSSRFVELHRLEAMRRSLMEQAERDLRIKTGISPLSTWLRCELLEQEERRKLVAVAAQSFSFNFMSMLPDFESLRREATMARWQAVVGYFSSSNAMSSSSSKQEQQRHRQGEYRNVISDSLRQHQQQQELFVMLSPLRGASGASSGNALARTPATAEDGAVSNIAYQIELLHLSAEEQIARDSLSRQILSAQVWRYVGKYRALLTSMNRQFAVLCDAEAFAWMMLMSWDGSAEDADGEAHRRAEAEKRVNDVLASTAQRNATDADFDHCDENRELFPLSNTQPIRGYVSNRWQRRIRNSAAAAAARTSSSSVATSSRFHPNIASPLLLQRGQHQQQHQQQQQSEDASATTPNRAAIHNYALRNSSPTPASKTAPSTETALSSTTFAAMSEIAFASANPVLFRALIAHARRLQRIGRAYLERSGPLYFLLCESQDRRDIVQASIAELYLLVEDMKRDKITIAERATRAQKQQHVRMALGLVEALCKKRELYRLRRFASKLVLYPAIAARYNATISVGFEQQQQEIASREADAREGIASQVEKSERTRLLHESLVSAEHAMTVTIRRRWSEHEELISKARAAEAQNQRRERVLQDKIYELLQQKQGDVSAVTAEANRLLAKEMAETERIKEMLWGRARTEQLFAEQEKDAFVAERRGRAEIVEQQRERWAAIGREAAQSVFLTVTYATSSPARGGVVEPSSVALFAQSRPGLTYQQRLEAADETPLLSPEVRMAARQDRDQRFFEWLSSRTGVTASATYGDIQPLLSPQPTLTRQQVEQNLVNAIQLEDVPPWHKNIPIPLRESNNNNNSNDRQHVQQHQNEDSLLQHLTPIASPAQQRQQQQQLRSHLARGAALSQQQQQALFGDAMMRAAATADDTGTGLSFLSTNSAISPGLVSAPSVPRNNAEDDGAAYDDGATFHHASLRFAGAAQTAAATSASADSSVAAAAVDALSRIGNARRDDHHDGDLLGAMSAAGGADIWAAHDAACFDQAVAAADLALSSPQPTQVQQLQVREQQRQQQWPSPSARVIEVPRQRESSPEATAPGQHFHNQQQQQRQRRAVDNFPSSPPPILGPSIKHKQPSMERASSDPASASSTNDEAALALQKRQLSHLPIALGVAQSAHPTTATAATTASAGSIARGQSVSSAARDTSSGRVRVIVKKAAVVHHPGGAAIPQPGVTSLTAAAAASSARKMREQSDDDGTDDDNDDVRFVAAVKTAHSGRSSNTKAKTNEQLKSQYEYERDLFSSDAIVAGGAAQQHLDSSRGAIEVPRGALRPQSAGERNCKNNIRNNKGADSSVVGTTPPPLTSSSRSSAAAGAPSLRSMLHQQQQQEQQQVENQQFSSSRSAAKAVNTGAAVPNGNGATSARRANSTSLMALFQQEKSHPINYYNNSSNNSLLQSSNTSAVMSSSASSSVVSSSARRVFGSGLPRGGQGDSPSSKREQSPPLRWTAHAASISNRDSDVPEKLNALEAFAGKVKSSVDRGKRMREESSSGNNHNTSATSAIVSHNNSRHSNATSLLRRASDVMTDDEIAQMELERAQEAATRERENSNNNNSNNAQRLWPPQQQQLFISNSSDMINYNTLDTARSSTGAMGPTTGDELSVAPGALGLGKVVSPQRVRVNDAAFHYRYFNSNGGPPDSDLLRSNISGTMQRFDDQHGDRIIDDDFVVARNPQMAHRYGIVRVASSAPESRMNQVMQERDNFMREEGARMRRQQREEREAASSVQIKTISPPVSGAGGAVVVPPVKQIAALRLQAMPYLAQQQQQRRQAERAQTGGEVGRRDEMTVLRDGTALLNNNNNNNNKSVSSGRSTSPQRPASSSRGNHLQQLHALQQQQQQQQQVGANTTSATAATAPVSSSSSPPRKTVKFSIKDAKSAAVLQQQQQKTAPAPEKIVLRRAHEVLTPPRDHHQNVDKENMSAGSSASPAASPTIQLPRTSKGVNSAAATKSSSPPQILVSSPSMPRSPAAPSLQPTSSKKLATAGGGSLNSSAASLSANYKPDFPWTQFL